MSPADAQPAATDPAPAIEPTGERSPSRRRRRVLYRCALALAAVVTVVAVLAVWVNRQLLDTTNITNTSSAILADRQVQTALGAFMVTALFNAVDVQSQLRSALPSQLQSLAGPIASGLRQVANSQAPRVLATSPVQAAFRQAVRVAHATFVRIVKGGGTIVTTNGGVVTLNLLPLVAQLASQLGLSSQFAAAQAKLRDGGGSSGTASQQGAGGTGASTGEVVILRSSQLKLVQTIVAAITTLALILPLSAVALFALAVWLAQGRRRQAIRTSGWALVGIGLLLILVRRVGGDAIVNDLVKVDANKPAAHDVWGIATTLLYDIAIAILVYGLVIVVVAWVGGATRLATALRRALAPTLRDHPARAYAAVGLAFLLILVWGPTPAFRQVIPIVLIAGLLTLGTEVLRRQTANEFPDAQTGDIVQGMRARFPGSRSASEKLPPVA